MMNAWRVAVRRAWRKTREDFGRRSSAGEACFVRDMVVTFRGGGVPVWPTLPRPDVAAWAREARSVHVDRSDDHSVKLGSVTVEITEGEA